MLIDAFATQPHYLEHLAPVWAALPDDVRGSIYVNLNHHELAGVAYTVGVAIVGGRPPFTDAPLLMAGGTDLWAWSGRPVVLIEHGAGQSYVGADNAAYAGGVGRDAVRLFLCPNAQAAARDAARYPHAEVAVVGDPTVRAAVPPPPRSQDPVVAFTWHWHCEVVPETRTSWPYWRDAALTVARDHHRVLGHAHPKIAHEILPWWAAHGIAWTAHWRHVAAMADVLVADNSSVMFEFAALDRPVVVLDAPFYRRDVNHGGRFWDWADVGVRIGDPADLPDAINQALDDPPAVRARRRAVVCDVYAAWGTAAAQAAADAVLATFSDPSGSWPRR